MRISLQPQSCDYILRLRGQLLTMSASKLVKLPSSTLPDQGLQSEEVPLTNDWIVNRISLDTQKPMPMFGNALLRLFPVHFSLKIAFIITGMCFWKPYQKIHYALRIIYRMARFDLSLCEDPCGAD